jgi:uncharacterized protein YqgC (DUF456 family)
MSGLEVVLAIVMLAGLVGVVLPVLPGLLMIAGAGLVWALAAPSPLRLGIAALLGAIAAGATVAAAVVPARRASAAGAPRAVLMAGAAGMVAGFFLIPVVGALIGFPAGIFVAETFRLRDARAARTTTAATLRGVGTGIAIQLAAGVTMMVVWVAAVLLR